MWYARRRVYGSPLTLARTCWISLASYLVDWQEADDVGYYLHRGTVYLSGRVFSGEGSPVVTSTILSGLPSTLLPAAPVSLTLVAVSGATSDTARDTALTLPLTYAATIHPDGTLSLDAAPPSQINTTPSIGTYWYVDLAGAAHARYLAPLDLVLSLAASWPLTPIADTYATEDLSPYLFTSDFTNVDARYAPHDERVHLAGHVQAARDGAQTLLASIPSDAGAGISPFGNDTLGARGSDQFDLIVGPGGASFDTDLPIKPADESPPVAWSCPPADRINGNYISADFGADDRSVLVPSGSTPPSETFDLAALFDECQPAPDWFLVAFQYTIGVAGISGATVTFSGGLSCLNIDGTPAVSSSGGISGYLSPPTADYLGPTLLPTGTIPGAPGVPGEGWPVAPDASLLWKAGQQESFTVSCSGVASSDVDVQVTARVYPLYERRQNGLRAGDVIDLTGAGWPGCR